MDSKIIIGVPGLWATRIDLALLVLPRCTRTKIPRNDRSVSPPQTRHRRRFVRATLAQLVHCVAPSIP